MPKSQNPTEPPPDRKTTTARIYVETISVLRMLSERRAIPLIEYLDILAKEALKREGQDLINFIKSQMGDE
jgi:hypothetical protein